MSNNAKAVIAVVVAVIVLGGLYYWYVAAHESAVSYPSPNPASTSDSAALPSGSDTSDSGINTDMTEISGQMQGLDSDSANVDQSVDASGNTQ